MNKILLIGITLALHMAMCLLLSYPLMLLWNSCLVPAVTITAEIEWLQAWGLLVLVMLMTKTDISIKV